MNIYALSSGRGPSGIAIVRISGKDTLKVCKNLTKLKEINSNEIKTLWCVRSLRALDKDMKRVIEILCQSDEEMMEKFYPKGRFFFNSNIYEKEKGFNEELV